MKYYLTLIIILFFLSCKNEKRENTIQTNQDPQEQPIDTLEKSIDTFKNAKDLEENKAISIEIKQKNLIDKKDEKLELKDLIIEKRFIKQKEDYTIHFIYPQLNESINRKFENFNNYINEYYVNIAGTEAEILKNKALCDSIALIEFKESRFIDYKIYNVNDNFISVVFYKENYYSGTLHPSYSFNCMNFDLNRGVFMTYEDFFLQGSEEELTSLINEEINLKINKGELYYDCWEISQDDFFNNKNNLVINETYIEYYFDDCIMCPSYTGSYSVKIPLTKLLSVIKKHHTNPLI